MTDRLKPSKPRPDFPLTAHQSGKWCKKVKGKLYYFGRWEDPDGAEREWDRVKNDLRAGRAPIANVNPDQITVKELFNAFLERRQERVDAGTYAPRSYHDLRGSLKSFAIIVGAARVVSDLHPGDFATVRARFANRFSAYALNRNITNVKTAFRWADKNGLIRREPVYGDEFNKVPTAVRRREVREKTQATGKKMFTAPEIKALVKAAPHPIKAMILLAVNCGFYAADCASLHRSALDLKEGYMEFPRTKTEVMRGAVLWPETVAALREAIKVRPKARHEADDGLVFLTQYGNRWVHDRIHRGEDGISKVTRTDAVNLMFGRLLDSVKLGKGKKAKGFRRAGVNFSALRHTYRTIADELPDKNAVLFTMGHQFPGMDEFYVRAMAKPRLQSVADHVRARLLNAQ